MLALFGLPPVMLFSGNHLRLAAIAMVWNLKPSIKTCI
jgi:hypothetical protein